jgi:hypothetical protein
MVTVPLDGGWHFLFQPPLSPLPSLYVWVCGGGGFAGAFIPCTLTNDYILYVYNRKIFFNF